MGNDRRFSAMFLIQLSIGVFFLVSGLMMLMHYNSGAGQFIRGVGKLFGKNDLWNLAIALIHLFAGFILAAGVFISLKGRTQFFASFAILILWAANIVIIYFMDGFLKPDFLPWLKDLSLQLIILAGLWGTTQNYD
jgi:hypothetical protein